MAQVRRLVWILSMLPVTASAQVDPGYFQLSWSNDFLQITRPTDHYYTNGLSLAYGGPFFRNIPLNVLLWSVDDQTTISGLGLTQDIYTPIQKDTNVFLPDDRPFAAVLYLSATKTSLAPSKKIRMTSALQLGVIGPAAGGEILQNFIHVLSPGSELVEGWPQQIRNGLLLNYQVELEKNLFLNDHFQMESRSKGRIGSLNIDLSTAVAFRLGQLFDNYQQVLPFPSSKRNGYAHAYGLAGVQLVAYDGTLHGSLLHRDERWVEAVQPEIARWFWEIGLELTLPYGALRYGLVKTAPDFEGGQTHRYGKIEFNWRL